jgi:hypothetical protein
VLVLPHSQHPHFASLWSLVIYLIPYKFFKYLKCNLFCVKSGKVFEKKEKKKCPFGDGEKGEVERIICTIQCHKIALN